MQHVVSQLIEKKRELEGELNYHQSQINTLSKVIHSMEVSIKVFEPHFEASKVTAKKFNPNPRHFENGEALMLILNFLRGKDDFSSTNEITIHLMKYKRYDHTDADFKNRIQKSVLQVLRNQRKKGLIIKREVSEKIFHWKIA